jgi:hypothetical protein
LHRTISNCHQRPPARTRGRGGIVFKSEPPTAPRAKEKTKKEDTQLPSSGNNSTPITPMKYQTLAPSLPILSLEEDGAVIAKLLPEARSRIAGSMVE